VSGIKFNKHKHDNSLNNQRIFSSEYSFYKKDITSFKIQNYKQKLLILYVLREFVISATITSITMLS